VNFKQVAQSDAAAKNAEIPKIEIKNTFIDVEIEAEKKARAEMLGGIPRSYSDSDIHRLAVELEMEEARTVPKSIFAQDDVMDLSSIGSGSQLTSKSRASSFLAKSEVSSLSGGSITKVRVGTESFIDEEGLMSSKGSNLIQLSEYGKLPVNELGMRLPAASVTHQPGRRSKCRKCAFYNTFSLKKGRVCKNGALCDFCHETHDRFIHRR
jgi:hypothetical protein